MQGRTGSSSADRYEETRRRQTLLRAVLGLAVDVRTRQTLVRRHGLHDQSAAALMLQLAAAVGGAAARSGTLVADDDAKPNRRRPRERNS